MRNRLYNTNNQKKINERIQKAKQVNLEELSHQFERQLRHTSITPILEQLEIIMNDKNDFNIAKTLVQQMLNMFNINLQNHIEIAKRTANQINNKYAKNINQIEQIAKELKQYNNTKLNLIFKNLKEKLNEFLQSQESIIDRINNQNQKLINEQHKIIMSKLNYFKVMAPKEYRIYELLQKQYPKLQYKKMQYNPIKFNVINEKFTSFTSPEDIKKYKMQQKEEQEREDRFNKIFEKHHQFRMENNSNNNNNNNNNNKIHENQEIKNKNNNDSQTSIRYLKQEINEFKHQIEEQCEQLKNKILNGNQENQNDYQTTTQFTNNIITEELINNNFKTNTTKFIKDILQYSLEQFKTQNQAERLFQFVF
jgi:hypothetical protein